MAVLTDDQDRDAKVRCEQSPRAGPSLALLKATNGQHRLLAVPPTHPGALQPLGREGLASHFNASRAHRKPTGLLGGVIHPIALVLEVRELATQALATRFATLATQLASQPTQLCDSLVNPSGLIAHDAPQPGVCGASLDTLVPVIGCHGSAQMIAGMSMIDDPGRLRVEGTVEGAPVFLGPIGDRHDL
jgi:hypothetical protein